MSYQDLVSMYVGRPVQVSQQTDIVEIGGNHYPIDSYNSTDPILTEMKEAFEKLGYEARIFLPNSVGTCDYRTDRVNISIIKTDGGMYQVSNIGIG